MFSIKSGFFLIILIFFSGSQSFNEEQLDEVALQCSRLANTPLVTQHAAKKFLKGLVYDRLRYALFREWRKQRGMPELQMDSSPKHSHPSMKRRSSSSGSGGDGMGISSRSASPSPPSSDGDSSTDSSPIISPSYDSLTAEGLCLTPPSKRRRVAVVILCHDSTQYAAKYEQYESQVIL